MRCKRCGNDNPAYFFKGHKGWYCRKCVAFKRILLEDEPIPTNYEVSKGTGDYSFNYELTSFQKNISIRCLKWLKNYDVLIKAVCGAGKTEIAVLSMAYYLNKGLKVCYAIPRREVVKDLYWRFMKIFKDAKVTAIYGGHTKNLKGDLIICTTHQLFRFYKTFDLLVLDEVDAYPLAGNKELLNIALNSVKGRIIFSTATVNDFLKDVLSKRNYKELTLYSRPSQKPLIEPKVYVLNKLFIYIYLFYLLKTMENQCIIFVSNKKLCRYLYFIYSKIFSCTYVYSDLDKRDNNINAFKNKEYKYIFSTTVLERGVTFLDINAIIININKGVFNEGSLVQMLGRVGRNFNNPYGEAYILTSVKDKEINKAVNNIKEANEKLKLSLLRSKN